MRPRSRPVSKRGLLLPTISEGEETLRTNDTNTLRSHACSQSVSSEDYLLSICHLALPTFPTRDVSTDPQHQRLRLPRRCRPSRIMGDEDEEEDDKLAMGNADPLEYLYGQPSRDGTGSRSHSIPSTSSPGLPWQRKNSCPEFLVQSTSPQKHRPQTQSGSPVDGQRTGPAPKQSFISHWISECRSAWREARVRACMLPAIAEI